MMSHKILWCTQCSV